MVDARPYRRDTITLFLLATTGMHRSVFHSMGAVMPALRKDLDISATLTNAHVSAIALGMMAMGLMADRVAKRIGRRPAVWLGMIGIVLGMVMLALAPVVWLTLPIALLFIGVLGSLVLALTPAALSDHQGENRAVALAESSLVSSVIGGIVPAVVGLSQRLGFGWGGAAIVPVGMFGLLAAKFRHTPIPDARSHPGYAEHGQPLNRGFWSFWLTLVFTDSFEFGLIFGAAVLLEYRGMSQAGAATALSLLFWGMIVGRYAGSRLVRRIAPIRLLRITFALAGVGIIAHWLSPVLALSLIGLFLAGIGISNLYPLTTSIGLQAAEFNSSAAGSRLSLASGISMLVAPLIFGILTDLADIRVAFAVEPVFLMLAIATAGYGARWLARPTVSPTEAYAI
jgi:MFS family permease